MILNFTLPVSNPSSTYRHVIGEQQAAVFTALDKALAAMASATPRERDYQSDGYDAFPSAIREHRKRVEMVQAVRDAAYQIANGLLD